MVSLLSRFRAGCSESQQNLDKGAKKRVRPISAHVSSLFILPK
jgi:hypothetical protein